MAFGEEGILGKAQLAKEMYANDTAYTEQSMANATAYLEEMLKEDEEPPIEDEEIIDEPVDWSDVVVDAKYYEFTFNEEEKTATCNGIKDEYLSEGAILDGGTKITKIGLPDKATENGVEYTVNMIGVSTFAGCTGLEKVNLPEGITIIGGSAFSGCTALEKTNVPDSVTILANYSFSGCTSLKRISMKGVTTIGAYAFENCTGLESINLPDNVTTIGAYAFENCTGLESINLPDNVTAIGVYAFQNCTSLQSIRIPNSVTTIYDTAFTGCTNLTTINIDKPAGSIAGEKWGAENATIIWNG